MKKKLKYIVTLIMVFTVSKVHAATYVDCGSVKHLPYKVLQLSNTIINVLQIAVPIILIIMGSVDFVKAVSSQKEDDIKKAQGMFVKRLIMGALVFFIVAIVKLLLSAIGANNDGIWGCVECFVNNASSCK